MKTGSILVCFAVKEEARPFVKPNRERPGVRVLITGIGRRNAEKAIRDALATAQPDLVLSCGFAGGLDPALTTGTVILEADEPARLERPLLAAGARRGRFHCAEKVATTVEQKRALREATGAEAVEMESQAIRSVCQERGIASATLRVILDTADEELPLDFNLLLTPEQKMDYGKLAKAILRAPGKLAGLRRLQKQSTEAADRLADVLDKVLDEMARDSESRPTPGRS